ncbi:P-loop containing nucleoside triphosphate hydrolase protein [Cadophora sp. DSE1049]|nr:P-loop containing nucleoside triphosphate hydrolase protein [Cadophora sp. DSE1049]
MKHIIVVFGPSGCGKSTVGKFLHENREFEFLESDQYQPKESVEKMKSGSSLNGLDHAVWLRELSQASIDATSKHEVVVVSCSALKRTHRNIFRPAVIDHNKSNERQHSNSKIKLHFLFLQICEKNAEILVEQRQLRDGDYMPMDLVRNQFQTLEVPRSGTKGELSIDCTIIDAGKGVEWMLKSVEDILEAFLS